MTSSSDAETSEDEPAEAMPRASSTKGKSGTRGESSTPIPSGRAATSVQSTGSVQSVVSFDPQGRVSSGEGLADAPAAPLSAKMANSSRDSASHDSNDQFAALRAGEKKRLAEHIPEPQRVTVYEGRTRGAERRLHGNAQVGLVSIED